MIGSVHPAKQRRTMKTQRVPNADNKIGIIMNSYILNESPTIYFLSQCLVEAGYHVDIFTDEYNYEKNIFKRIGAFIHSQTQYPVIAPPPSKKTGHLFNWGLSLPRHICCLLRSLKPIFHFAISIYHPCCRDYCPIACCTFFSQGSMDSASKPGHMQGFWVNLI